MNTPDDLRYAKTHEWVRMEKDRATVGITDHAQNELNDVVFVDLPKPGKKVNAGDVIATVESVKAASDIYAPVGGEVIEANAALSSDPGLINREPYANGWLFRLKPSSPATDHLLSANQYTGTLKK
ncbi:MAG: glycine cleavage system protein GcvH [Verrucomicrobia bacterium]|nr:glycine cleavage system protein GcvH [Verrucomicrobiota bacterium]